MARKRLLQHVTGHDFVALFEATGQLRWAVDLDDAFAIDAAGDHLYVAGTRIGVWKGEPTPLLPRMNGPTESVGYVLQLCP